MLSSPAIPHTLGTIEFDAVVTSLNHGPEHFGVELSTPLPDDLEPSALLAEGVRVRVVLTRLCASQPLREGISRSDAAELPGGVTPIAVAAPSTRLTA